MEDKNFLDKSFLAGVDEVGRGPLAGPVVAACALLSGDNSKEQLKLLKKIHLLGVTDSKKLKAEQRQAVLQNWGYTPSELKTDVVLPICHFNNCKLSIVICEISSALIDSTNILAASLEAMANAFECHQAAGEGWILVDGNHKLRRSWPGANQEALVKGDERSVVIGLASIFAKEYRDHHMKQLGVQYPGYGLEQHAGYATLTHREAIAKLGVTPIHRKSFRGVKEYI